MNTTQATAAKVLAAIDDAERPRMWVAKKSNMALTTLNRKVAGIGDFTVPELARIARALGISPASLLPEEFATKEAVA